MHEHTGNGATAAVSELDHTADVAMAVTAGSYADLLAGAALGLARIIGGDVAREPVASRSFAAEGDDLEALLVELLGAVLVEHERDGFLPAEVTVHVAPPARAEVVLRGAAGIEAETAVKAVTYHDLRVKERAGLWSVRVTFDV